MQNKYDVKISKNFYLWEYFDENTFKNYPEHLLLGFLDPRIIQLSQFIRDRYNKGVTINDWMRNGTYSYSGFRAPLCLIGATMSQHKFGRGCDYKVSGMDCEEIRDDIRKNFSKFKEVGGLTTIEKDTKTWVHCDLRWTKGNRDTLLEVAYY